MKYIVFDLEATCDRGRVDPIETIEIGAVMVNDKFEAESEFERFVRPIKHPVLSDYCKELTSIKQSDVDSADTFPVAFKEFEEWATASGEPVTLLSWGKFDKRMFMADCRLHDVDMEWMFVNYINLKAYHSNMLKVKSMGLLRALERAGIKFEGHQHRGIVDAHNTAKVLIHYKDQLNFNAMRKENVRQLKWFQKNMKEAS